MWILFFGGIKARVHPRLQTQWANVQWSGAVKAASQASPCKPSKSAKTDCFMREEFQWREQTPHSSTEGAEAVRQISTPTLPRFIHTSWKINFGGIHLRLRCTILRKSDHFSSTSQTEMLRWQLGIFSSVNSKRREQCLLISRINKNNGARSLVHSKQNYSMLALMPRLTALLWGFSAANKRDNLDFVLNFFKYMTTLTFWEIYWCNLLPCGCSEQHNGQWQLCYWSWSLQAEMKLHCTAVLQKRWEEELPFQSKTQFTV